MKITNYIPELATERFGTDAITRTDHNPDCCQRCGSRQFRNVEIHNGRSQRQDCARCGRFHSFPLWYGTKPESDPRREQATTITARHRHTPHPGGKVLGSTA